jgi:hypothetical protein
MAAVTCARCGAPSRDNEVFCTDCGAALPLAPGELPYARSHRGRRRGLAAIGAVAAIGIVVAVVLLATGGGDHGTLRAQAPGGTGPVGGCPGVDVRRLADAFGNVISSAKDAGPPPADFFGAAVPPTAHTTSCAMLFLSPQSFGEIGPEVAGMRLTVEQYPTEAEAAERLTAIGEHARATQVADDAKVRVSPTSGDESRDVRDLASAFGPGAVAFERNDTYEHVVFRVGDKVVALTCDTTLRDPSAAAEFDTALLGRMEPAGHSLQKAP